MSTSILKVNLPKPQVNFSLLRGPVLKRSFFEITQFFNKTINLLEESAVTIDVQAVKKNNLLYNQRQFPTTLELVNGLEREALEFFPEELKPNDEFFDDIEDLKESFERARESHHQYSHILEELRSLIEEKILELIEKSSEKQLERARFIIESLNNREVSGFLSENALSKFQTLIPEKTTRIDARKIEKIIAILRLEIHRLNLQFQTNFRYLDVEPVWGYSSTGVRILTLPPQYLGIVINPYDGTLRNIYRTRTSKFLDLETAMRSLKHAIGSEIKDREQVADDYTKKIIAIINFAREIIKNKKELTSEDLNKVLSIMQEIFSDIGRGAIKDHDKIRSALRTLAAIRALNCYRPLNSLNFSPIITARRHLLWARAYLTFRRYKTLAIESKLERKYASLYWYREQDRIKHEKIYNSVIRALNLTSEQTQVYKKDFLTCQFILESLLKSIPRATYYGYQRATQKIKGCLIILQKINKIIEMALFEKDKSIYFEYLKLSRLNKKINHILHIFENYPLRAKKEFADYLIWAVKQQLRVLLNREYINKRSVLKREIEQIFWRISSFSSEETEEIIQIIRNFRKRVFPENGQNWQKDGFRLTSEAIKFLVYFKKITEANNNQKIQEVLREFLKETRDNLTEQIKFAVLNNQKLLDSLERFFSSINQNLNFAIEDLKNRTKKV